MGLTITGGINLTGNVTTSALFLPGQATLASRIATYTGTANQANVAFIPPASAGSLSITSHSAISTPGNIVGTVAQASAGNVTVTGLTQGTTYTFKVFATSGVGNGAQSSGSTFPLVAGNIPATPTAPTVSQGSSFLTAGTGSVIVSYTAPSNNGIPISSHTAQSSPDNIIGSVAQASSGNIIVSGLMPGTAYTFTVFATNDAGSSPNSPASDSVTPEVGQQTEYTTSGTYTWIAPTGVSSVSVVAVGGGGGSYTAWASDAAGGGGGGLGYANISVTAGNPYTVVVGTGGSPSVNPGGQSYFSANTIVAGNGGTGGVSGGAGGGHVGNGGGDGGSGDSSGTWGGGGGAGAGGYSGTGGNGGFAGGGGGNGANGSGGAGGGGAGGRGPHPTGHGGGGGGGVGLYGAGPNGVGGTAPGGSGGGGSGGSNGGPQTGPNSWQGGNGGLYGGGGAGTVNNAGGQTAGNGGNGAVRIIWGSGRNYPSTNTANAFYSSANYPGTPTIGTVSVPISDFVVSYTAGPAGSFPIVSHTAISTPGNITATANQASSGSITYSNSSLLFTVGTSYTFKVFATNLAGSGPQSAASASYTWTYGGQQAEYTTSGTYTWIAPSGVSSVSVVAVGGGGGGSTNASGGGGPGGGLGYANVSVTGGTPYTVVVGAGGGGDGSGSQSYFSANTVVAGNGGGGGVGGGHVGNGGGNGGLGRGSGGDNTGGGTGGGAGGYAGAGGNGGTWPGVNGSNGAGGGGGGGGSVAGQDGAAGGGVGIYGQGPDGAGGVSGGVGQGGSSGGNGGIPSRQHGGLYGGGAGGRHNGGNWAVAGGSGAVRIIWGSGRNYPSTNTANVAYGAPDIPGTPTSATAILSGGSIGINYVAGPAGSIPTLSHAAISTPGNLIASVSQANSGFIQYGNVFASGVTYSFNVYALNAAGRSPAVTTNSLFYQGVGYQAQYVVPGSYTWIAPTGVSNVSTVAIGGGGSGYCSIGESGRSHGGAGGGLGFANVSVTAGNPHTVVVGAGGLTTFGNDESGSPGSQSYFANVATVAGNGGGGRSLGGVGGGHVGNGGGNGGNGGPYGPGGGAGGGAGGYSGTGGNGGEASYGTGADGNGGGGGGASGGGSGDGTRCGGGGGGVGIYGTGPSGLGGVLGNGGGGGSYGANGQNQHSWRGYGANPGGLFGGGGGSISRNVDGLRGGNGANGAVRIIWASPTYTSRTFPSANTQDVYR